MAVGRKQFERIIASAARENLRPFTQTNATPLAAGQSEQLTVFATAGKLARVLNLLLSMDTPTGATSGEHRIFVSFLSPTIDLLWGKQAFGNKIYFDGGSWVTPAPSVEQFPTDPVAVTQVMHTIQFDSQAGMTFTYYNSTNVVQDRPRVYRAWLSEREVG